MSQRRVLAALVFSFLLGLSPLAADPVIQRGIDAFITLADGRTYYDFAGMRWTLLRPEVGKARNSVGPCFVAGP